MVYSFLLTCLDCLRRRTRSITNKWYPGWSVKGCCHSITQGQLGVFGDLVSPAEWWASSWAAPWWRLGGGQSVDGLGTGMRNFVSYQCSGHGPFQLLNLGGLGYGLERTIIETKIGGSALGEDLVAMERHYQKWLESIEHHVCMGHWLIGRDGNVSPRRATLHRETTVKGEKCEKIILQTTLFQNSDRGVEWLIAPSCNQSEQVVSSRTMERDVVQRVAPPIAWWHDQLHDQSCERVMNDHTQLVMYDCSCLRLHLGQIATKCTIQKSYHPVWLWFT